MSRYFNTPYWRQRRAREFDSYIDRHMRAEDMNSGVDRYEIDLDWRGSSYMVTFDMNGYERQVNIISECRERFGRLTAKVRSKIEAVMPETILIGTKVVEYYAPYCAYNIGGYRYVHSIDQTELEKWFQQVELSDS